MKFIKIICLFFVIILNLSLIYSDQVWTFTEENFTGKNIMVKDGYIQLAYTDYGLKNFLNENKLKLQKISIYEKRTLNESEWMRIDNFYYKLLNINDEYIEKIYLGNVGLIDGNKKDNYYYVEFNIKVDKNLFNNSNFSGVLNNIEIIDKNENKYIAEYNYNFDSYSLDLPISINKNNFYFPFDKYKSEFKINNAIINNFYNVEPILNNKEYTLNLVVEKNKIYLDLKRNFLFQYFFILFFSILLAMFMKIPSKKSKNKNKFWISFISIIIFVCFISVTKNLTFICSIGSIIFLLTIGSVFFIKNKKAIKSYLKKIN
jgi:hypothetical protein